MNRGDNKDNEMKRLLIILTVLIASTCSLYPQNKSIRGRVIDDNLETLPYVSIAINDTVEVSRTNLNGFFQIDIPVSAKRLSFSTVGVELASIELLDKCDEIEIVMMLKSTYDFITLKKANRLRIKRFKKLPRFT